MKPKILAISVAVGLLVLDQASKLWIRTHMAHGESIEVLGRYFQLFFIENNGMAFGLEWGGRTGKLLLSSFRLIAVVGLGFYFWNTIHRGLTRTGGTIALALIWAGACGNIVDSLFYGRLFGYEDWMYGRVVDMLYFPLFQGFLPDWLPVWGGDYFVFFRPVFNLADTGISVGVGMSLFFYKRIFVEIP
ncbi:MAG: lipoprotein signal peptidase [Bacteroidota bacterium]|nr:lipoprotein signal peptidase [Bacteroidota bacterium]